MTVADTSPLLLKGGPRGEAGGVKTSQFARTALADIPAVAPAGSLLLHHLYGVNGNHGAGSDGRSSDSAGTRGDGR